MHGKERFLEDIAHCPVRERLRLTCPRQPANHRKRVGALVNHVMIRRRQPLTRRTDPLPAVCLRQPRQGVSATARREESSASSTCRAHPELRDEPREVRLACGVGEVVTRSLGPCDDLVVVAQPCHAAGAVCGAPQCLRAQPLPSQVGRAGWASSLQSCVETKSNGVEVLRHIETKSLIQHWPQARGVGCQGKQQRQWQWQAAEAWVRTSTQHVAGPPTCSFGLAFLIARAAWPYSSQLCNRFL
eukprot:COSAG04_NODE_2002_length_5029_cov_5.314604_8_plen_244_part_00